MTNEEARELARKSQAGDLGARDELLTAHRRMASLIGFEWARAFPGAAHDYSTSYNDLEQECLVALLFAIADFQTDGPVPFRSFARARMRAALWRMLKKQLRQRRLRERFAQLGEDWSGGTATTPEDTLVSARRLMHAHLVLRSYLHSGLLTRRQFEIVCAKLRGLTNKQVGLVLGVSRETVRREMKSVCAVLGIENAGVFYDAG